jgi:hypothetical protein
MKSHRPPAELRVRSVDDDEWTWSYVEPDNDVELYSNEVYPTAEDARDWARRAYPKVPFAEHDEDDGGDGDGGEDAED